MHFFFAFSSPRLVVLVVWQPPSRVAYHAHIYRYVRFYNAEVPPCLEVRRLKLHLAAEVVLKTGNPPQIYWTYMGTGRRNNAILRFG